MLDVKNPNINIISVVTALNTRLIEDDETGLTFIKGRETIVRPRDLRSHALKKLLIDGKLKVINGIAEFDYKGEHFKFSKNNEVVKMDEENLIEEEDLIEDKEDLIEEDLIEEEEKEEE